MRKWTMRCVTVALACGLGASLWLNFKMQDGCDRIGRISDAQLEIERRELYAAYRVEEDDFHASHEMMGGGTISHSQVQTLQAMADTDRPILNMRRGFSASRMGR